MENTKRINKDKLFIILGSLYATVAVYHFLYPNHKYNGSMFIFMLLSAWIVAYVLVLLKEDYDDNRRKISKARRSSEKN